MKNRGQIVIQTLLTIAAFIGAIVAPTLFVGDIKQVNAVQDNRIETLEQNQTEIKNDIRQIREGMNALLLKQGINPDKVGTK